MSQAFNQLTVACQNTDCPRHGEERVVSLPIVGNGIYARMPLYCECGSPNEMRIIDVTD